MTTRSIATKGFERGLLWLDELPAVPRFAPPFREHELTRGSGVAKHRELAVELWLPRGGMIAQGMLGLSLEPSAPHALLVPEEMHLAGSYSVLGMGNPLRLGIEAEFLEGVLEGVESVPDRPAGRIVVTCAGICDVGSSRLLFARMAAFLMRTAAGAAPGEDDYADLTA